MIVGQIVKFRPAAGMDEIPAIVTRVWNDFMINLTAFPDGGMTQTHSSVQKGNENLPGQGYVFREIG